jgi:hypothetical protein
MLGHASAAPLISAQAGNGDAVDVLGVGFGWDKLRTWPLGSHVELDLSLLARVNRWHGTDANPVVENLWDFSLTPVLRIQGTKWPLFLDLGVGVHLLSHTRINENRQFSTRFQFGEFIGPGVRLGPVDVSYRLEHVSNGGIKNPNDGLTYHSLVLQYHF